MTALRIRFIRWWYRIDWPGEVKGFVRELLMALAFGGLIFVIAWTLGGIG